MPDNIKKLNLPLERDAVKELKAGDYLLLSGEMLTARDAAHKRICATLSGNDSPFDFQNATIYYVGPCFAADGTVLAAGPTTAMRMDAYAPELYDCGVIATVGKGDRGESVYEAIKRNGGVYLAAIGGAGAVYAESIVEYETVCYADLGTEAVRRITVKDFPVIVAIDSGGSSVFSRRSEI